MPPVTVTSRLVCSSAQRRRSNARSRKMPEPVPPQTEPIRWMSMPASRLTRIPVCWWKRRARSLSVTPPRQGFLDGGFHAITAIET